MASSINKSEFFLSKWIGSTEFYKKVFIIAFPIIIQNLITNFVNLLDNIMVGQVGTDSMNGVSIVNQLFFVFNLCIWGGVSGAGIFTAQYFGKGDTEGVRNTFRAKIIMVSTITVTGILLLFWQGDFFISKFLHETDGIGNAEQTLYHGKNYLKIMLLGLVPLAISMAYSNTLRDIGQTRIPMIGGITAVLVNLIFNWILIFGHLGFPKLGVEGAAIATVISRFIECLINVLWTHTHKTQFPFIISAYRSLKIPANLMKQIIIKGTPLALNEALWALGLTFLNQNYSIKGLSVIAAMNITSTLQNLFNVIFFAIGESISIIAGQLLGAKKFDEAKSTVRKMLFLSVCVCAILGIIMSSFRHVFPNLYNTEAEVRNLASTFILIMSFYLPFHALLHGSYFTLRCGGKTIITFLFDSCYIWGAQVSCCFCLTHFTNLEIIPIYIIVSSLDLIKAAIGVFLVHKGIWINNIVNEE